MIIKVLLIIMALLSLVSGIVAFFGSHSKNRVAVFWYLIATIGAASWTIAIATFFSLTNPDDASIPAVIAGIYVPPLFLTLGLCGYNSWHSRFGRVVTVLAATAAAFLSACIITSPDLLYDAVTIDSAGSSVHLLADQPFYICYCIFFFATVGVAASYTVAGIKAAKKAGHRIGSEVAFFIGLSLTSLAAFFFNIILPVFNYSLIWVGPLAMACGNIGFYYRLVRRHLTSVSAKWMTVFSYFIVAALASMLYLIVFYAIFTALFNGGEPSPQVIVLNFLMFLIIILSIPSLREITSELTSLVSVNKVNMSYIVKKLNQLAPKQKNYQEIVDFLADHLHFDVVAFIIDGKVYSSELLPLAKEEIQKISTIPESKKLWQVPNESTQIVLNKYNINAVAPLGKNRQILIGKPLGHKNFKKSDLTEIETIINLVAAIL